MMKRLWLLGLILCCLATSANAFWVGGGSGGAGIPGGANTQIQFNDGGVFGGLPSATINKVSGAITFTSPICVGAAATPIASVHITENNTTNIPLQIDYTYSGIVFPTDFQSWQYRKPITIQNTGVALTNYQIKSIVAYIPNKINSDFSDIRFATADGVEINHWREEYVADTTATFWIQVPVVSVGTTTIYMYYGKPTATSVSNGNNTFLFFDDFNDNTIDTAKWVKALYGATANVYEENQELRITDGGVDADAAYLRTLNMRTAPYILGMKIKGRGLAVCIHWDGVIVGRYSGMNTGYFAPMYCNWDAPTQFYIQRQIDGGVVNMGSYLLDLDLNWHKYETVAKTNGIDVYYDGILQIATTDITLTAGYIGLHIQNGSPTYFDNLYVRQYTATEPNSAFGGEEGQSQNDIYLFIQPSTGNVGIGIATPDSTLHIDGSFATAYRLITSAYTVTANDCNIECNSTAGIFTIALPTAVGCVGREYVFVKNNAANDITIDPYNAETINGAATYILSAQWSKVTIVSNGANWLIKV